MEKENVKQMWYEINVVKSSVDGKCCGHAAVMCWTVLEAPIDRIAFLMCSHWSSSLCVYSYRGRALSHLLLENECILDYLQDAVPKYNICILFLCLVWDCFFFFQDRVRLDSLVLFQLFIELCLLSFNLLSLNHQFEIYNVYFPYIHNFRSS